jgi:hypothetical protein
MRTLRLVSLVLAVLTPLGLLAQNWNVGDVFVAVGNGQYKVFTNSGSLKSTITIGATGDVTSGCAFDSQFNFYGTDTTQLKFVEVNAQTGAQTAVSTGLGTESLTFDADDNLYVGNSATTLLKYAPALPPLSDGTISYTLAQTLTTPTTTDWIDLGRDQQTLFYTSKDFAVHRFNVATATALSDFLGLPHQGFAVRLLPPFDGSGGALVADTNIIFNTASPGTSYGPNNVRSWIAVALDPDGQTFWAGDFQSGKLFHFNIATGASLLPRPGYISAAPNKSLGGVCVKGSHQQNVVPLVYQPGTNVKNIFQFGNPSSLNFNTWSARFDQVTSPFILVLSATEGIALSRFDEYFCNQAEQIAGTCPTTWPSTPSLVPIPYGNQANSSNQPQQGRAVVYRVENPPPTASYTGNINIFVAYNTPTAAFYNPPLCPISSTNPNLQATANPRLFRDPSVSPPSDAAANHSFAFDFTLFVAQDANFFDPLSGGTRSTNDYVVADRCPSVPGGNASYNSPLHKSTYNLGSVIPVKITVVNGNGNTVSNAVTFPNDITLVITDLNGNIERNFFSPGNSFSFFTPNGQSYAGNLDTSGLTAGTTTLCVTSIDKSNPGGLGTSAAPGLFPPQCVQITLR